MTYVAVLSHQKDEGTTLRIEEARLRDLVREQAGSTVFGAVTCIPAWLDNFLYQVRWGRKDPEYGIAERSLGHLLFRFGQWAGCGFGMRDSRIIDKFPVTGEWVQKHFPDVGWPWDGTEYCPDE